MNKDSNFSLSDEARKAQREYKRQWRAAHPDKVRESNRKYWEKRAKLQAEKEEAQYEDADN